ncbi:MAG: hypothetical protein V9E83_03630 [Baekduia sp.]
MDLRDKARDQFLPGKFICPHSAIWDHAGNIFVVEWVEVGRDAPSSSGSVNTLQTLVETVDA